MPSSLKPVENPRHAASPPPERPPSSPAPDSPAQNAKSAEQALIDRAAEAQSRELVTVTLERGADGRLGLNVDRTPGGYPVVVAPVPDGLESGDVVMLIGGRPGPETVTWGVSVWSEARPLKEEGGSANTPTGFTSQNATNSRSTKKELLPTTKRTKKEQKTGRSSREGGTSGCAV